MNFDILVSQIQQTHDVLQGNARLVINRHVTAKAWLTGYYIVEYELHGEDRAKYGEYLLQNLAERLKDKKTFSYRSLKLYKQFYQTYKQLDRQIATFVLSLPQIRQTASAQLPTISKTEQMVQTSQEKLFNRLSFSHLSLMLPIKDPLQRAFYETMAIRGTWSVRELQLKMYLNYFRKNIMQPDDNPPVGILMCSEVGQEMAEYTLTDMDATKITINTEEKLFEVVSELIEKSRRQIAKAVNTAMVYTYYGVGQYIVEFEKPTIGILLCEKKNDALVELTLPKEANIYAQEYALCLPKKEELQQKLVEWVNEYEELNPQED